MKLPFLLGRVVFGGFFLFSGIRHFIEYKNMGQYVGAKHVPLPEAAVLGSGALLAAGGASILLGAKPKLGALALLTFLTTASPSIHDFWNDQDPAQKQNNMSHFMKNMALLGGALALLGIEEPWPASIGKLASADEAQPSRLSERRRRRAA